MNPVQLTALLSGRDRTVRGCLTRLMLSAATPPYRAAVAMRNRLFDSGLRRAVRLPRPTISVGNLTAGGTGKTPMVITLARGLREQGSRPAVLLRGYRSQPDLHDPRRRVSDEAQVLKQALGASGTVESNPDRRRGAELVLAESPQTTVLILDDGFQHRQVHRDLDLVLIDATRPFGFGRLLPRGLLREPVASLRRADAVIVTHCDQVDADRLTEVDHRIRAVCGTGPVAHAAHRWTALVGPGSRRPIEDLRALKVVGVCGIGNPGPFTAMLVGAAGSLLGIEVFNDHHDYTTAQVNEILRRAGDHGAEAVVTTEKDWVKWRARLDGDHDDLPIPVLRPELTLEFLDGREALDSLLRDILQHPA